ncbi:MAG: hypothetical protein ACRDX8_08125, partial [Acidimicrobiales bacterium]
TVMAVPGSVRSPASAGTNGLIADGCAPVRDVDDVLVALGLSRCSSTGLSRGGHEELATGGGRRSPGEGWSESERRIWCALDPDPTPTDVVLRRTGLSLGEVAAALDRLESAGWARPGDGWWERTHP